VTGRRRFRVAEHVDIALHVAACQGAGFERPGDELTSRLYARLPVGLGVPVLVGVWPATPVFVGVGLATPVFVGVGLVVAVLVGVGLPPGPVVAVGAGVPA
jgi:hypothetical protein